jgi:hypothetical protein
MRGTRLVENAMFQLVLIILSLSVHRIHCYQNHVHSYVLNNFVNFRPKKNNFVNFFKGYKSCIILMDLHYLPHVHARQWTWWSSGG